MNPAKHVRPSTHYKNRILAALPKAEIDRLAPYLLPVTLKLRTAKRSWKAKGIKS